jgi:hypothetical protein
LAGGTGATRITGTDAGADVTAGPVSAGAAYGPASSRISFGNAIAAAPPTTASATVSARANLDLMDLPLPADTSPRGLIGNRTGN